MVQQHGDHHDIPDHERVKKPGSWLPTDHRIHRAWLSRVVEHVDKKGGDQKLVPALQEFKDKIYESPRLYMYFTQMWDEVPNKKPYTNDPTGRSQIRDMDHMFQVLNHIFGTAPEWTDAAANVGMVGVPMAAIFDYAMGTPSGHAAFLDPEVNAMLKKVLNEWGRYLKSPESAKVLGGHDTGWFGPTGVKDILTVAGQAAGTKYEKFEDMFVCTPGEEYYGYKSWDDFFTRKCNPQARPVASPDDDSVIANACESKPYCVARNVKLRNKFWIKGQPYSVLDILAFSPLAKQFAGGTIYQAFLSALSYHRWHSPVSGTIKKAFVQDGTYFSEPLREVEDDNTGKEEVEIDQAGIQGAQGYLTAVATRAIIFIEADNKDIGLMAFVGVGMDEVSTCEITVTEGQRVKKGDELGMFHFGGSTHCLLFRPGVKVRDFPAVNGEDNVPVRAKVAVVDS
ncbi:Phophatidylserine decarboxylase-domain-containing protein [Podospora australis]|uniref:Phophatidylserine decarboxylase-domain-containing protein n=1 Tax=Podospora australis TaxID=1536484 RepID=A0AAN6X1W2_9PEZI|nr:Phophatidylserine decarboxylase-domain-containing protein [Podospora australis]